jgi:hypothetical protein
MSKPSPNRITYERLGVLVSDSPAYKTQGSTLNNLIRVQSVDYDFSHPGLDLKSVGFDNLVVKDEESPVVRQGDVRCNLSYLFSSGENEEAIGFNLSPDHTVLKNFIDAPNHDDVNVMIVAANDVSYTDLNNVDELDQFEGYNVVGLGNSFLIDYNYQASVGELPSASLTYDCSNMKFDVYESADPPTFPSLKLGLDNQFSQETITLDENTFNPEVVDGANAIMPGDILIEITKKAGDYGGVPLEKIDAAIQSISIDVPIPRQSIYGFGSNYVFDRKLKLPIIGSTAIDMIVREFDEGQIDSFFTEGSVYDIKINHTDRYFNKGELSLASVINTFVIEGAQLKQQAYSVSIGGQMTVGTFFTFGIGREKGLKLYRQ